MRLNFGTSITTQKQNLNSQHTHTHVSVLSSLIKDEKYYGIYVMVKHVGTLLSKVSNDMWYHWVSEFQVMSVNET